MSTDRIRFLLNNEVISLVNIDPNQTVLDYLRLQRSVKGTKEGCGSGDCGACTVVVAELSNEPIPQLRYRTINSCLSLIGSLHGKQLITVEDLKQVDQLHPVQQAFVDHHASQCGFCTPGFIMSSFALHKSNPSPSRQNVKEAFAGNLCRCTGYASIVDAGMESTQNAPEDSFAKQASETIAQLTSFKELPALQIKNSTGTYHAPINLAELSELLLANPEAILIAGGTDLVLLITQHLKSFKHLIYLGNVEELNRVDETKEQIIIGSAVPYNLFSPILAEHYPDFGEMINRIGSTQIRNLGTLGGNIGNASPIGDMPPALIALDAKITLQRGDQTREIPLEDYFTGYKKTILASSEFIKEIIIEKSKQGQFLKIYKVSKRLDDDISTVLAAISIQIKNGSVCALKIAFGGMAAIPKRARHSELALLDKPFCEKNIKLAQIALSKDFQPLSDVRASTQYRLKIAQNILLKCYLELKDESIQSRVTDFA